jgi:altronate dehydratase small subunit
MPLAAIIIDNRDNVATALRQIEVGEQLELRIENRVLQISLIQLIAVGHKFALVDILKGEPIIKYGEIIGQATEDILTGQHVHVHNVEGLRGRGDRQ